MNITRKVWPGKIWPTTAGVLLVIAAALAMGLAALAQDDGRAPGDLAVETSPDGIVLVWSPPTSDPDGITDYEIVGSYVRRGVGIVQELLTFVDGSTTTWTDLMATEPDLLYVYRVRALRDDVAGQWSSFVISEIDPSELPPTAAAPAPEPTRIVPVAPVAPTAAVPEPEPTRAGQVARVEPTRVGQVARVEPTRVVPVARVEPTRAAPVARVEPTSAPRRAEPTASRPRPEPTGSA